MKPIYYFTVEGISSSVFESQVHAYVNKLRSEGLEAHLIIGQKYKARIRPKKLYDLYQEKHTKFMFLPQQMNYEKQSLRLQKRLPDRALILHCRNIEAAYIGWRLKQRNSQIELLYDVRGYIEDEMRFFKKMKRGQVFEKMHRELFASPIYFNFISEPLRRLYEQKYGARFTSYSICPSSYNDDVFSISPDKLAKPGRDQKIRIVFVGGTQTYQKIENLITLNAARSDISLTVITNQKLKHRNPSSVRLMHGLSPKEVAAALEQMDYGILYRNKKPFNEVATPTKIAEYWSMGLRVLAIGSAGAYTAEIQSNPFLGELFSNETEYQNFIPSKIEEKQKLKIARYAKEHFSLSANFRRYRALYKEMNQT